MRPKRLQKLEANWQDRPQVVEFDSFFEAVEEDEDVVLCNTCGKEVVNYNDDGVCADCQMRG